MTRRRKYCLGNWKMHKTQRDAEASFDSFREALGAAGGSGAFDAGICAPALSLQALACRRRGSRIRVLAQNAHWAEQGAFTGEISVGMLRDVRVDGSLVAHSERRQHFGETDASAGLRAAALLKGGCEAVLCVGETLAERQAGAFRSTLRRQINGAAAALRSLNTAELVGSDPARPALTLAYEPVWAIGTGLAATPEQAQEAHAFLREEVARVFSAEIASSLRLLYGGSVNLKNVTAFTTLADVDGVLVGGASLDGAAFAGLCLAVHS